MVAENKNTYKKKAYIKKPFSHFHEFEGVTSFADGHVHEFFGKTVKTIGTQQKHYHSFEGITSSDDGHQHIISTTTGYDIVIDSKNHAHSISDKTLVSHRHNHIFECNVQRN